MCGSSHFPSIPAFISSFHTLCNCFQLYEDFLFIYLLGRSLGLQNIYILILQELKSIQYLVFLSRNMILSLHLFRFSSMFSSRLPLPTPLSLHIYAIFLVCSIDFRLYLPVCAVVIKMYPMALYLQTGHC